jgi:hypothetical protein
MTIVLCSCKSDQRATHKTYNEIATVSAILYDERARAVPTFILLRDNIEIDEINYIYVADWASYYFVNSIRKQSDNVWLFDCAIDMFTVEGAPNDISIM